MMLYLTTKYLITAAVIVLISEIAKRSDKLGGLLAALPLVTLMTLIWLYLENQSQEKIANHAWFTFWYVLPTLPMFLAFPWLLQRFGFWLALSSGLVLTLICFALIGLLLRYFGIQIF